MHFLIFLIFAAFCCNLGNGYVAWQYPAPRNPPLDGLDSRITKQPCGVPRPTNAKFSNFATGVAYNFTWRMDNDHEAGLRISLYNSSGIMIKRLVPAADQTQDFFYVDKYQLPMHQVTFESVCPKCIVRLEKESTDKSFVYHSCADINLVDQVDKEEDKKPVCVEAEEESGPYLKCHCDAGWDGEHCQYKVDCVEDSDCGVPDGLCVAQPNSIPLKICYCPNGRFGKNCEKESVIPANECFNAQNEDSSNYSSYGIFNESCYKKVDLNNKNFVYSRLVQNNQLEVILDFGTNSFVAIGWRSMKTNTSCRHFPQLGRLKNGSNGFIEKKFRSPLSPMDCTDVVWGAVHRSRVVIRDSYSRDMSTPLDDEWFGGEDNIVAVYGWQLEDYQAGLRTIVLFRRSVKTSDPADHPLGPSLIFGIYAKGAAKTEGDETTHAENEERVFFQPDELDLKGENRGMVELDFVTQEEFEKISDGLPFQRFQFKVLLFLMSLHIFLSRMV